MTVSKLRTCPDGASGDLKLVWRSDSSAIMADQNDEQITRVRHLLLPQLMCACGFAMCVPERYNLKHRAPQQHMQIQRIYMHASITQAHCLKRAPAVIVQFSSAVTGISSTWSLQLRTMAATCPLRTCASLVCILAVCIAHSGACAKARHVQGSWAASLVAVDPRCLSSIAVVPTPCRDRPARDPRLPGA